MRSKLTTKTPERLDIVDFEQVNVTWVATS